MTTTTRKDDIARQRRGSDVPSLLESTGLTYRKLDYWTRRGYVNAGESSPGSGHRRTWPPEELRIAALMGRLTDAGLSPDVAAFAARFAVATGKPTVHIGPDLALTIEDIGHDRVRAEIKPTVRFESGEQG